MTGKEKRGNKAMKQDFIITKERIDEIGKHLETIYLVHRNVENDTKLTKEEKMIQELYDNYLELLIEYRKQKEVIDKIMNLIKQYGKYDGKKCTRGFQMWSADFNKILDMLKEV